MKIATKRIMLKLAYLLFSPHMDYDNTLLINIAAVVLRPFQRIHIVTEKITLGQPNYSIPPKLLKNYIC